MPSAAELRRRDRRHAQSATMTDAAEVLRERGPGGFAGLDTASAAATATLMDRIAAGWRDGGNPRVWDSATRVARFVLDPADEPPPIPGPLPEGFCSATLD